MRNSSEFHGSIIKTRKYYTDKNAVEYTNSLLNIIKYECECNRFSRYCKQAREKRKVEKSYAYTQKNKYLYVVFSHTHAREPQVPRIRPRLYRGRVAWQVSYIRYRWADLNPGSARRGTSRVTPLYSSLNGPSKSPLPFRSARTIYLRDARTRRLFIAVN